jgi:hypothetical protein
VLVLPVLSYPFFPAPYSSLWQQLVLHAHLLLWKTKFSTIQSLAHPWLPGESMAPFPSVPRSLPFPAWHSGLAFFIIQLTQTFGWQPRSPFSCLLALLMWRRAPQAQRKILQNKLASPCQRSNPTRHFRPCAFYRPARTSTGVSRQHFSYRGSTSFREAQQHLLRTRVFHRISTPARYPCAQTG